LDEQIRQATHIIGLPENWNTVQEQEARAEIIRRLVRARAEWVLRWILDKLKDETDVGKTARANATAWQLLDWMIHVLPVSRSAPHLRDASFPSILERTLLGNFDKDSDLQPAATFDDVEMKDASESSETIHEGKKPSKKRKRGTADTSPAMRAALGPVNREQLFRVIGTVIRSITSLAAGNKGDDNTQAELMKMVLRTESAQASRILRFWLTAVHQISGSGTAPVSQSANLDGHINLYLALEIWDLRTVDAKDETGASAGEFNTECLTPTLALLEHLKSLRSLGTHSYSPSAIDRATTALDNLLARHLLAPSRAAFFADLSTEPTNNGLRLRDPKVLASNLEPLRAKLLQAAQVEDSGDALTLDLKSLFNAVPHLLDLAIRVSPSRTPKGRSMEKPWLQAVFSTLAECAGCSLDTPPEFITRQTAVTALSNALCVLQLHEVSLTPDLMKTLFWYHCGVKYPERQERQVHWSLIASLIELDPSVFVAEQRSNTKTSQEQHTDLTEFIFDQISTTVFDGPGFTDDSERDIVSGKQPQSASINEGTIHTGRAILKRIVIPLMSAFVRNRNLLGFIRRWDEQLVKSYRHGNRKALEKALGETLTTYQSFIWEDRALNSALAECFEQSLTQGQIATLINDHAKRLTLLGDSIKTAFKENVKVKKLAAYKNAASSAVLIPAFLQSIQSDDTIEALKSDLHSLFLTYATWVQEGQYSQYTRLSSSWFTLCQLLAKLWPIELHSSAELQHTLLHPLLEQATKDMSTNKLDCERRVGSRTTLFRAAAMLFALNTCNRLQTVPGSKDIVRNSLREVTPVFTDWSPDSEEQAMMIQFFCAFSVNLLENLDPDACCQSLYEIFPHLTTYGDETRDLICKSLSCSIIEHGSTAMQNAYCAALLKGLIADEHGNWWPSVVANAMVHIHPSALSREQRQSLLDRTTELLSLQHEETMDETIELLSIVAHLQQVPNATAKISTDAGVIFTIAEHLHENKLETETGLQLLRELVQRTLSHIIPNQNQAQNKEFFIDFAGKLLSITKATDQCSPARLSILRATSLAQQQNTSLHIERYVELLKKSLASDDIATLYGFLDAFNELPLPALREANLFNRIQTWLRTWTREAMDFDDYISSPGQSPDLLAQYVARLHTLITKFELYPDTKWLIKLTLKVLQESSIRNAQDKTYAILKEVLAPLPFYEKLDLVRMLTDAQEPRYRVASYRILHDVITTMDNKLEANTELKQRQLALLPRVCVLLAESSDFECFNALLSCVNTILDDKPLLASQYSIECVFSVLVKLTSRSSPALSSQHASDIFSSLCYASRLILLVHRGRLGGRFHLLLPLLQGLLFCLFIPNTSRSGALPSWLRPVNAAEPVRLTAANAAQFTRLLSTLCNPPQSSITKAHQHHQSRKSKDLNDPVKAAREKASNFLYPLLASFCRYQLGGRLDQEVRETLMPGIWEIVGTASLHREGLDAMFAGLGRSERDVWKGLWEEWEGVYGRRQVVGHGE
jgi:nucleolar pre-ribosomal-associated protein 2